MEQCAKVADVLECTRQRFLHGHVLAGFRGADREWSVQMVGDAQVDQIDVCIVQDRIEVRYGAGDPEFIGECRAAFGATRAHRVQADRRRSKASVTVGVDASDESSADQTDTDGPAHPSSRRYLWRSSRCCGNATAGSASSGCHLFSHSTEM